MPDRRLTYSIIIPVYNKWALTGACLDALAQSIAHRRAEGEVIVVDDASTDETPAALGARGDVDRTIRHEENTGFQGAASDGAAAARGEVLIFLNNDTTPQPGWLDALLEALNGPNVGIAGAMFLFPDGRVQEFGGIVWRDASARHIGAGLPPSDPLFARPRDVDYVSGAGMAIRASLWNELGGFDPALKPAYYEDTDLCMKVRASGKRVVVTPKSKIVHVMGGSKDVDPRKSHDTMMSVNRQKFLEKWKPVLDREHWPAHPYFVETASDRSPRVPEKIPQRRPDGKRLLFVYWVVPQFDRQSGDRRLYEMMLAYRDAGHAVTVLAFDRDDAQAEVLARAGIEVWHGDSAGLFMNGHERSLEERLTAANFDMVYFGSPHVARLYMGFVRSVLPGVPIVTDAIDLAFRRVHRDRLLNDPAHLVGLPLDREWEMATYAASDALTSVSAEEAAILRASGITSPIELISNFYKDGIEPPPFGARSGIAIVVNMRHHPNLDALRWFLSDVWPLVLALKPDMFLTICGNGTESLRVDGEIPNMAITGYVPSIEPLMRNARVNVAPLRVGAGVKGKVTEAMRNGLPTVTTPIGAEGLGPGSEDAIVIDEDPRRLAQAIVAVHEDEGLWNRLSTAARAYAQAHFSRESFAAPLESLLNTRWEARHSDDPPSVRGLSDAFSDPHVGVATFACGDEREKLAAVLRSEPAAGAIVGAPGDPRVALCAPAGVPALAISRAAYFFAMRRGEPTTVPIALKKMREGELQILCTPGVPHAQWAHGAEPLVVNVVVSAKAEPARIAAIVSGVKQAADCRLSVVPAADLRPELPGEVVVSEAIEGLADVRFFDGPVGPPPAPTIRSAGIRYSVSLDQTADVDAGVLGEEAGKWLDGRTVAIGEMNAQLDIAAYLEAVEKPLRDRPVRALLFAKTARQLQLAWSCGIPAVRAFNGLPERLPGWTYVYARTAEALQEIFADEKERCLYDGSGGVEAARVTREDVITFATREELFALVAPAGRRPRTASVYFDEPEAPLASAQARLLAFYLPQFHPTPENDQWWGAGFTEWHNVSKARPLFPEHYQPHLPGELGFYDLRLAEARLAQARLAQAHGIHGFIYYHYWFNGRRMLHRPLDEMIGSGQPEMPFALCWANENWTRAWDGRSGQQLLVQEYSKEDDLQHIRWLCGIFEDPRYIRIGGKPLMLVYRPSLLPNPQATAERWRRQARKAGFGDLYLCRVESFPEEHADPAAIGFDASIEFQPDWTNLGEPKRVLADGDHRIFEYADVVRRQIEKPDVPYTRFPGVTPGWDNSARRKRTAHIFEGNSPELYGQWLRAAIAKARRLPPAERFVVVNAWNEWAEGNHLEPDWKSGRAFLEATRTAVQDDAAFEIGA